MRIWKLNCCTWAWTCIRFHSWKVYNVCIKILSTWTVADYEWNSASWKAKEGWKYLCSPWAICISFSMKLIWLERHACYKMYYVHPWQKDNAIAQHIVIDVYILIIKMNIRLYNMDFPNEAQKIYEWNDVNTYTTIVRTGKM